MLAERKLTLALPDAISDEAFYRLCRANQNLRIERNAKGEIEIMAGTGGKTAIIEAEIGRQLSEWNRQKRLGKTFGASGGFKLKNGSIRLADAAWMSNERWNALSPEEQARFVPAPDFVVEIRSPSDSLSDLQEKMREWIQNGARLAWLVNPQDETVFIYRENGDVAIVKGFDQTLSGDDVLPDFQLSLSDLK